MLSSRLRKLCAAMLGDIRSGSAKMTSKPIATAPSSARRVMRSATVVRGQGPLADLPEARFVDADNDDRPQPGLAWPQGLVEVEGPQPDFLERRRVRNPQRDERKQEQDADRSCQTEAARPASQLAMPSLFGFTLEGCPVLQAVITCQAAHQRTASPIVE